MKSTLKKLTVLILLLMTAVFASAGLSSCSHKREDDSGNNSSNDDIAVSVAGKWNEYDGVKLAFMDEKTYNSGELKESLILPELNCKIGEKYYMVADFGIQAPYDNDGRENLITEVKVKPASAVSATIQETNSGNITEETVEDTTILQASYKIPESTDSVRNIRLTIQLTATDHALASIDLSFKNPNRMEVLKTAKIVKTAVIGYTEGLISDGNKITGMLHNSTVTNLVIPTILNGVHITNIANESLNNLHNIKNLIIPESIQKIGSGALNNCSGLERIEVSNKNENYVSENNCILNKDKTDVILGCKNSIIPSSVISINEFAFCGSGLNNFVIPSNVTSIGESAFKDCNNLTSIIISDRVISIGFNAFSGCNSLESIILPFNVASGSSKTHFGYIFGAKTYFDNQKMVPTSLKEVIVNGGSKIDNYVFYNCTGIKKVTIPDCITRIGSWAFHGCQIEEAKVTAYASAFIANEYLKEVVITGGESIGIATFSGCRGLKNILLPNSVSSIEYRAFYNCGSLASINYNGTKSMWDSISKGNQWNTNTGNYTIYCFDGTITK